MSPERSIYVPLGAQCEVWPWTQNPQSIYDLHGYGPKGRENRSFWWDLGITLIGYGRASPGCGCHSCLDLNGCR